MRTSKTVNRHLYQPSFHTCRQMLKGGYGDARNLKLSEVQGAALGWCLRPPCRAQDDPQLNCGGPHRISPWGADSKVEQADQREKKQAAEGVKKRELEVKKKKKLAGKRAGNKCDLAFSLPPFQVSPALPAGASPFPSTPVTAQGKRFSIFLFKTDVTISEERESEGI